MDQRLIDFSQSLIANEYPPECLQPRIGSFDNPAMTIPSQFASVLVRRPSVVLPLGDDRVNAASSQHRTGGVRVVASIPDEPLRRSFFHGIERRLQQLHLRRGRRVQVKSERSTLAINQYHKLRSFPAFCLAHFEPPFLAEANVPSTKHASQRTCWRSESWAKKACQTFSRVPSLVHFRSRRYTLEGWPYREGNSLHGAPVQRIQRIPSKHFRSSLGGRPPFRSFLRQGFFRGGRFFATSAHWASDNCLQANSSAPFADKITTGHGRKNKTYANLCRLVSK